MRKKLHDIKIHVVHQNIIEGGALSDKQETSIVTLDLKFYEYAVRLGSTIANIFVQLFTQGKVRVHFGRYVERLELVHQEDRLTGPDAMDLFDEFAAHLKKTEPNLFKKSTQQIFVKLNIAPNPDLNPPTPQQLKA